MFSNVGKKCFQLWCVLCAVQFVTIFKEHCNSSKVRHKLPDDGPDGPKHVACWNQPYTLKVVVFDVPLFFI